MSATPNVCVLNAPGVNCNFETGQAFDMAGAETEQVHISQLQSGDRRLDDYQVLALSGGFSYGDDIAAGRILGLEIRKTLGEDLNRFVEAGKVILGICNGFQVLVESGMLPDGQISEKDSRSIALAHNESGHFECRWTQLAVEKSISPFFLPDDIGEIIELPVAHAEGRFLKGENKAYERLIDAGQVLLRYCDANGNYTEDYPGNPNASPLGITGICDPSGHVVGLMPHPERFVRPEQHPNWRRGEGSRPIGAVLCMNIVDYLKAA
jgi:phosphoribosylformylglycinamidine synthase subunit PurQ / glutaminase